MRIIQILFSQSTISHIILNGVINKAGCQTKQNDFKYFEAKTNYSSTKPKPNLCLGLINRSYSLLMFCEEKCQFPNGAIPIRVKIVTVHSAL